MQIHFYSGWFSAKAPVTFYMFTCFLVRSKYTYLIKYRIKNSKKERNISFIMRGNEIKMKLLLDVGPKSNCGIRGLNKTTYLLRVLLLLNCLFFPQFVSTKQINAPIQDKLTRHLEAMS